MRSIRFWSFIATRFPETHQSGWRVAFWFISYAVVSVSILYLILFLCNNDTFFETTPLSEGVLWFVVAVLAGSLVAAGITELAFTFKQWKTNQQELQQMEEKQLQTELDVVKQQVNPHFLFNCLNSLSVLISEAPATAEKFVDEMSKVYRYLLSVNGPNKETSMVTLEAELRFIRSYIYLLETRFESGIEVCIEIDDVYLSLLIAPLTLQTLIDNAIRHNVVSTERPLRIHITTRPTGQLEVRNNLQKRLVRMPFSTAGLATLISRYKMLFNQAGTIQIKESEAGFSVLLPLIHT
ncbi:sensor histidine kinase [Dyadobacter pollutisoli]|uniref:Histidine kinase n=1 Tax=Dyadobacter pollutisoli TaxID=2910158 RepID=A0A9E8NCC8_9BACT|nr:histidine kinase [Dyadobacter pollutisoli]WAC14059.1 histidine kinase [Dyadobacter pollutisoli]